MGYYIVDRIENGFAVCEDGDTMVNISLLFLPSDVHEGSVLRKQADGTYVQDIDEENRLREEAVAMTDDLFDE